MITHSFTCDDCSITIQDTDTKCIHKCPTCGGDMRWNLNIGIHGNYKRPIHSDSLAINPNQRAEHEKLFPNIRLDGENRPIFSNFTEHENYLEKTGFVKHTQKLKPKSKRIKTESNR